ncbi:MAG: molybdopterin-guanine dinucleotide biosynthesis protein B, partial [Nitrospinaceae bacterium]
MDRYWERFKTPFICFAGFSGVGKTTLLEHMIRRFKEDRIRVGYYKHDAHRFQVDKKGKDTQRGAEAGAGIVTINDPEHFAVIGDNPFKKRTITHALEQCDCILIEGYKKSPFDKIVLLDADGKLPIAADDPGIKAIIHQGVIEDTSFTEHGIPLFHRDEADKIYQFVKDHFYNCTSPLLGGVFIGGQSKRMGLPKFSLSYQGQSETERMVTMLSSFCDQVYLSARQEQDLSTIGGLQQCGRINDEHYGLGPVGGLATLMGTHPDKAWLITACDMPFLQEDAIERIVGERDPLRYGTCFLQKGGIGVEPMCAIYEPKFIVPLFEALSRRELSLTRIISDLPFKHVTVSPS